LWDNNYIKYGVQIPAGTIVRHVERGDFVKGDHYSITILHPYEEFYSARSGNDAENNQSVVIRVEGKGISMLFTGDISKEAEEDIIHLGGRLRSAVMKVPHHGSRRSLTEGFLYYVRPKVAIVSSGRNNRFGHPHEDTLARLSEAEVYSTNKDGAIGITEMPDGSMLVKTWQQEMMKETKDLTGEAENIKRLFSVW
jgi:competence protein ComEC